MLASRPNKFFLLLWNLLQTFSSSVKRLTSFTDLHIFHLFQKNFLSRVYMTYIRWKNSPLQMLFKWTLSFLCNIIYNFNFIIWYLHFHQLLNDVPAFLDCHCCHIFNCIMNFSCHTSLRTIMKCDSIDFYFGINLIMYFDEKMPRNKL